LHGAGTVFLQPVRDGFISFFTEKLRRPVQQRDDANDVCTAASAAKQLLRHLLNILRRVDHNPLVDEKQGGLTRVQ
jgi:hypothetical protein